MSITSLFFYVLLRKYNSQQSTLSLNIVSLKLQRWPWRIHNKSSDKLELTRQKSTCSQDVKFSSMVIKDNANILWCALHKQIADKNLKVINHFLVNGPNKLMGFEFKSNFAKPCAQKITMQIWTDMEKFLVWFLPKFNFVKTLRCRSHRIWHCFFC